MSGRDSVDSAYARSAVCSDVYIVAHQDDDLLFMNPDIANSIRRGNAVRTIYLTAGDAGGPEAYWARREAGIRAAYAQMAGVPDVWSVDTIVSAGKALHLNTLLGGPQVSVVFLRLPDGNYDGAGYAVTGWSSLQKLWNKSIAGIASVDGANRYSRDELVALLADLIVSSGPMRVGTLDSSKEYGDDHSDHRHAASFAIEAHRAGSIPGPLNSYRGYNISGEPVNLTQDQRDDKWSIFSTYADNDLYICGGNGAACAEDGEYGTWGYRQYTVASLAGSEEPNSRLAEKCFGTY